MNRSHKQTDVLVMDFAKAFDKVPHKRLLYKLDFYGIRGFTHKWIDSWLSVCSQKVLLDGRASDPVPVLAGVPQGSVLGWVLYLSFINELPDNIRSSVRLFVQDDLNSLAKWERDWQMKFNKAKAIHFSWLGPELLVCCLAHRGPTVVFLLLRVSRLFGAQGSPSSGSLLNL